MAVKKTTRKRSSTSEPSLQQQAELLQRKLGESAQQIWLAGVGAFGRAQTEGSRWFDTLVKEGSRVEQRAGTRANKWRDAVDSGVQGARDRAADTFDRVDQVVRGKVQGAWKSVEVPTRRELGSLIDKIDALNSQLRAHNAHPAPTSKASKTPTKKTAARKTPATKSAPVRKAATKKTVTKNASARKATKRAVTKTARRPVTRKTPST